MWWGFYLNNVMAIEINVFDAIYPAILKRFKIEISIIENIYHKSFDKESQKNLNDLDKLIDDIITGKLNTDVLTSKELSELIVKTEYEYRLTHRFNDFLSYFTITTLYSSYEKYLKEVVILPRRMDDIEYRRMSFMGNLIPFMKSQYGLNYNKLPNSLEIEELRCLNNSIKHHREVNAELHTINPDKWILEKEIENVFDDFQRLKGVPYLTLEYLTKEIKLIVESNSNN